MRQKSLLQQLPKPKQIPGSIEELEETALGAFDRVLSLENKHVPGYRVETLRSVGRNALIAMWHPRNKALPLIALTDLRKYEGHMVLQAIMPESDDTHEVDVYLFSATGLKRGIRHAYNGPLHNDVFETGITMKLQQSFFEMGLQDPPLDDDFRVVAAALSQIPRQAPRRPLA